MPGLVLRLPEPDDEDDVRAAAAELAAEGGLWSYRYDDALPWDAYLAQVRGWEHGVDLPPDFVPVLELVADVDGTIVGRASVRLELNAFLATLGGHVGYTVRPPFRGRGHATDILQASLLVARERGISPVLVTCREDNVASRRVIEKVGGRFEGSLDEGPGVPPRRRYWFG